MALTTIAGEIQAQPLNDNFSYLNQWKNDIVFNVKDNTYGAVGNGITGDTASIQAANDAAEANGGGIVFFPKGTYLVTGSITIDTTGVVWEGVDRVSSIISVPATFPTGVNGVIICSCGEPGPTIRRLGITFAQVDTAVRGNLIAFPPAIYAVSQPRLRVLECRITKAMTGIDMKGNSGGALIDDLEMSAFDIGVDIDGSLDSVRVNKFHFWPFGLSANQQTIFYDTSCYGIKSGRCDDIHIENGLFFSGVGCRFYQSTSGSTFGSITNTDFDAQASLNMEAGTISISGGYFSMVDISQQGIIQTGGVLNISAANFNIAAALTNPALSMVGTNNSVSTTVLGLTNCTFSSDGYDCEHVYANTGGKLIMVGNQFRKTSDIAYTKSIIKVNTGPRCTIIGNGISDKGAGAGTFIEVVTDDHHRVVYNTPIGWTITTPVSATGTYSPN